MNNSFSLKDIKHVYFLGIGGIGMSALARWFNTHGYTVSGYDRTRTPLTDTLQQEGMAISFDDSIQSIPEYIKTTKENTLIIYTPAIPSTHSGFIFFKENHYALKKRSEVLGLITDQFFTIAVAGTHGKTTTSSMVAHILKESGKDCVAFLGGITQGHETNFFNNKTTEAIAVVEADEFDRSFLTLHPSIAIVTSIDADHLDIYATKDEFEKSFNDFVSQINPHGKLFLKKGIHLSKQPKSTHSFGLDQADYYIQNLVINEGLFQFDLVGPTTSIKNIHLQLPGFHNVENALAAIAATLETGLSPDKIKSAIETFRGVKRRFEYILKTKHITFIDDYAHHPTEIEAFLTSVKAIYPSKKLTVIFQPHLYSRTRDFADGFAKSLSLADEVILTDIYPARELPTSGITSDIIFTQITSKEKTLCLKKDVVKLVQERKKNIELLCTIGAGDIDQLIDPIKKIVSSN